MQKLIYFVRAFSPQRRRTLALVGLSSEDSSHLIKLLSPSFPLKDLPQVLPKNLETLVHRLYFGEGIPDGCLFYLHRKRGQPAIIDAV